MALFKRNKGDDVDGENVARDGDDAEAPVTVTLPKGPKTSGPWDVSEVPEGQERVNFGSVLVPAVEGMQIRVELDEAEQITAITVLLGDTALQLQAFAAPRSEGIWDEVRQEIAEGIRSDRGRATEADGPFGREVRADVSIAGPDGKTNVQRVRFLGADGPRWFLRGLISGAGATDDSSAKMAEALFAEVAVDRGVEAAAPRQPLVLTVPESPNLVRDVDDEQPG